MIHKDWVHECVDSIMALHNGPLLREQVEERIITHCPFKRDTAYEPVEVSERLRVLLRESRREHFWLDDDCWYSCPKSDHCCNDRPKDVCTCGADAWNAKIDALLSAGEWS